MTTNTSRILIIVTILLALIGCGSPADDEAGITSGSYTVETVTVTMDECGIQPEQSQGSSRNVTVTDTEVAIENGPTLPRDGAFLDPTTMPVTFDLNPDGIDCAGSGEFLYTGTITGADRFELSLTAVLDTSTGADCATTFPVFPCETRADAVYAK